MKREATIGTATFLTIAAEVGFSLQTGPKQEGTGRSDRNGAVTRPRPSAPRSGAHRERPGCSSLQDELQEFLDIKEPILPGQCYEPRDAAPRKPPQDLAQKTSELKFVIALLPDPVHTHLSVLFDQFAVAIQEAAQDEKYDFDSSWLLWDDDDSHYALFADDKASNLEKEQREAQPGIILFRKTLDYPESGGKSQRGSKDVLGALSEPYRKGLVVFVVGEEANAWNSQGTIQQCPGVDRGSTPKSENGDPAIGHPRPHILRFFALRNTSPLRPQNSGAAGLKDSLCWGSP